MNTSIEKLRATFAESLGLPLSEINDALTYNSVAQWDSVAHMALVAAIEDAFDILIDTEDVIDLSSFGKAQTILTKYGVTF
ncbi:MAG: acyl carrier protein [Rhodocyclaceae bacterium]|nr:MAG: acyl carrier protein [Rhodocyclaceae bacterium]